MSTSGNHETESDIPQDPSTTRIQSPLDSSIPEADGTKSRGFYYIDAGVAEARQALAAQHILKRIEELKKSRRLRSTEDRA